MSPPPSDPRPGRPGAGKPAPDPAYGGPARRAQGEDEALAFVESPVQLLNVLEWAHASGQDPDRLTLVVLSPLDPMSRGPRPPQGRVAPGGGGEVRVGVGRGGVAATPPP
ncbi:hypothetical protein ACFV3T_26815, partial [Streptomyces albidoflavus]